MEKNPSAVSSRHALPNAAPQSDANNSRNEGSGWREELSSGDGNYREEVTDPTVFL
jgi:hypothetical protein